MTALEFSRCPDAVKFEILKEAGVRLATRRTEQRLAYLFAVDGFYVEVVQGRRSGQLWTVRSFDNITYLEPYLSEIDISPVLNQ
ncbi:MAG TPA: hypothetical protein VD794_00960 [Flavisolibacter sp.]|nr:hypothetical protein [Flavisolibacter sp.]